MTSKRSIEKSSKVITTNEGSYSSLIVDRGTKNYTDNNNSNIISMFLHLRDHHN
jgi:hypothetical protein